MNGIRGQAALARLIAWDAVTSLGESAAETVLLLRAGVSNVERSRFVDATGERVMLCRAPSVPPELAAHERMEALARQAFEGLCARLRDTVRSSARVLLSLPQHCAGEDAKQRMTHALESLLPGVEIETFALGRAGGAPALSRALRLIEEGQLVIWGGVDSFYDWARLDALERSNRLLSATNIDGVRPGEAAAFIALAPARGESEVGVYGIGAAREPVPVGSEDISKALGLTRALDGALAPLRAAGSRSNLWLLDNSHEDYATHELQNLIPRLADVLGTENEFSMPLKELGDAGAAAMPLLAVIAAEAWRLGIARDDIAVVTGCSDDGARGALLLGATH
jgi:3-oxoacyl-[acyl-carrier-protein] synthase I